MRLNLSWVPTALSRVLRMLSGTSDTSRRRREAAEVPGNETDVPWDNKRFAVT